MHDSDDEGGDFDSMLSNLKTNYIAPRTELKKNSRSYEKMWHDHSSIRLPGSKNETSVMSQNITDDEVHALVAKMRKEASPRVDRSNDNHETSILVKTPFKEVKTTDALSRRKQQMLDRIMKKRQLTSSSATDTTASTHIDKKASIKKEAVEKKKTIIMKSTSTTTVEKEQSKKKKKDTIIKNTTKITIENDDKNMNKGNKFPTVRILQKKPISEKTTTTSSLNKKSNADKKQNNQTNEEIKRDISSLSSSTSIKTSTEAVVSSSARTRQFIFNTQHTQESLKAVQDQPLLASSDSDDDDLFSEHQADAKTVAAIEKQVSQSSVLPSPNTLSMISNSGHSGKGIEIIKPALIRLKSSEQLRQHRISKLEKNNNQNNNNNLKKNNVKKILKKSEEIEQKITSKSPRKRKLSSSSSDSDTYDQPKIETKASISTATTAIVDNWVQCSICEKWRKLPSYIDGSALSDDWVCEDNTWDNKYNRCEIDTEIVGQPLQLKEEEESKNNHQNQNSSTSSSKHHKREKKRLKKMKKHVVKEDPIKPFHIEFTIAHVKSTTAYNFGLKLQEESSIIVLKSDNIDAYDDTWKMNAFDKYCLAVKSGAYLIYASEKSNTNTNTDNNNTSTMTSHDLWNNTEIYLKNVFKELTFLKLVMSSSSSSTKISKYSQSVFSALASASLRCYVTVMYKKAEQYKILRKKSSESEAIKHSLAYADSVSRCYDFWGIALRSGDQFLSMYPEANEDVVQHFSSTSTNNIIEWQRSYFVEHVAAYSLKTVKLLKETSQHLLKM